jgi:hypothetical protein
MGMLRLSGISSKGPFGQAKKCVINAFDTNYIMSANEVMASILHLAQNMDDDLRDSILTAPPSLLLSQLPAIHTVGVATTPVAAVAYPTRAARAAFLTTSCRHVTSSYDALLKWTLANRKMIIQKDAPPGGPAPTHASLLSDVPNDDLDVMPTLEECTDEYDDSEVSVPFNSVAFSSFLAHGRDLSQFWVIDSACSINLTTFQSDFVTFAPHSAPYRVDGVGVDVKGSGMVQISTILSSHQAIHRKVHALYTPDLSSRFAQRIGCLLSVSWMQSHSGCEFVFPSYFNTSLIVVPTGMCVLKPSGNGLYLLPHQPELPPSPTTDSSHGAGPRVALDA